jgi:hypothetical protein
MAGLGRGWTKVLAVAVLLMGAGGVGFAQSRLVSNAGAGSLSGRLTDLYSKPLSGVPLVLRNQATGAETRATTTRSGAYEFRGLEPGEYTLEATGLQLGRGQLENIVIYSGHVAHVQSAMAFEPLPLGSILEAVQNPNRPEIPLEYSALSYEALAAEPLQTLALSGQNPANSPPPAIAASVPTRPGANRSQLSNARLVAPALPVSPAAASVSEHARAVANQLQPPKAGAETLAGKTIASDLRQTVPPVARIPRNPVLDASQQNSSATTATATAISAQELQALPISGRHWRDFVLDNTPTSVTPAGGQAQIAFQGASEQAEITVDGVSKGLTFGSTNASGQESTGQGALGQDGAGPAGVAQVGAGGHGLALSEAAISAVRTETGNVEASAAHAAGGRMNVETRHGENELHGQGFLFDRQNVWGARNPFSQWVKETSVASTLYNSIPRFTALSYTPPDRETIWGFSAGSRIRRDKIFWFAAVDGSDRNDPGLATVKHPCLSYDGDGVCTSGFFANPTDEQMQVLASRLGLSGSNAEAEGREKYSCMMETLAGTLDGASSDCLLGTSLSPLLGPAPRTSRQWTGFGRLDWKVGERHHLTLEGTGAQWNSPGGGLTRVSETYGNHSFGSTKASEKWLLGRWEAFLSPNLLAVTQVSVGHTVHQVLPETPSAFEQTFLKGNVWGQLPQIVVDNRYGFTIGNPSRFGQGNYPDEHSYHMQESLDWVRGNLLVKAGFQLNHNSDATSRLRNQTGTYTYAKVGNFISDALVFEKYGITDALDPYDQHNCDQTGKVWRDSESQLRGRGNLPCYSYFSQIIGPSNWSLSTNDWAGYATAQWQAGRLLVISTGLRWEREQLPPAMEKLRNTELPLTEKLPGLGNQWGPRISLAVGSGDRHWPVLRLGYGMYFGRTTNATLQTALTQTGSLNGDLNFFMRPTDNLNAGGAPPFPHVLAGTPGDVVKPGAVEFAARYHNPEVHQGVVTVEEKLPGSVEVTASAMVSMGRRLPVSIDTNFAPAANPGTLTYAVVDATGAGPIKTTQITVPFYASWPSATSSTGFAGRLNPDYQQITQIMSRANSTYEAAMLKVVRYSHRGVGLRVHYTYSHAMDWNPNESSQAAGNDVLDPADFSQEYGTSNLDRRHSAGATVIFEAPWKLRGWAGKFGNGWRLSGTGQFHSGLPYTMRTAGSLAKCFISTGVTPCTSPYAQLNAATGSAIIALAPGMNGSGGDNRVYGIGRNTYRYPSTWKVDLRLGRHFDLGQMRELEVLAESFNLLNHRNVTRLETVGYIIESGSTSDAYPTLNFLTGLTTGSTAFGQPMNADSTNFYRERQIQFGIRMRF